MAFNYRGYGGYVGRQWDQTQRGVHDLTYSSHASTFSSGIGGQLESINDDMDGKSYSDVTGIKSVLEGYDFKLFMVPTYGGMAESMGAQSPISSIGKFDHGLFQASDYLSLSSGFDNSLLNDFAWYGFCGFVNSVFHGTVLVMYTQYTNGTTRLRDLWYPNADRSYRAFVRDANDTEHEYTGTQSTIYSDGQYPGIYGYNSTYRFSQDDGSFGFKQNTTRLDGNGGPYLNQNYNNSSYNGYGCENANSGDTSSWSRYFYWGTSRWYLTTYAYYFFYKPQ
jgi:hypothetical protein